VYETQEETTRGRRGRREIARGKVTDLLQLFAEHRGVEINLRGIAIGIRSAVVDYFYDLSVNRNACRDILSMPELYVCDVIFR